MQLTRRRRSLSTNLQRGDKQGLAALDGASLGYYEVLVGSYLPTFHLLHSSAMHKDASCRCRECTRKQYALGRVRVATYRLMLADSEVEKTLATRWVNAWAGAIGDLHFSAFAKGRLGYKPRR
ncbi:hypothetical protein P3T23_005506 [Paraburkholderia sp. GAS448]